MKCKIDQGSVWLGQRNIPCFGMVRAMRKDGLTVLLIISLFATSLMVVGLLWGIQTMPEPEQTYPFEKRYYEELAKRQRAEYDMRQQRIELTRWQAGLE